MTLADVPFCVGGTLTVEQACGSPAWPPAPPPTPSGSRPGLVAHDLGHALPGWS